MTDRLISANKFAEDIYRAWELWEKKGENCFVFSDIITPILVNQPTADARPVTHGHWTDVQVILSPDTKKAQGWQEAKCSICNKLQTKPYLNFISLDSYCPHCGAKMDEVGLTTSVEMHPEKYLKNLNEVE